MEEREKTPEEMIENMRKQAKELESKTKLTFMERRHYKKQIKIQQKAVEEIQKEQNRTEQEEQKIRKTAINALIEINGEEGNEGILDILDEDGKEMNRRLFENKTTEWLLETWKEALTEIAKIVGDKSYEK